MIERHIDKPLLGQTILVTGASGALGPLLSSASPWRTDGRSFTIARTSIQRRRCWSGSTVTASFFKQIFLMSTVRSNYGGKQLILRAVFMA